MYTAEDVRTDGPYTVMYTGGVDGPCDHVHVWCRQAVCTAHARPCTDHVYGTAVIRPYTDRFRGRRRVHGRRVTGTRHVTRRVHGRVHGRVHDTLHGRVHDPYAAAQQPSTRPWTARTRTCNCRVDFPCMPACRIHGGVMSLYTCHLLTGRVHGRGRAV